MRIYWPWWMLPIILPVWLAFMFVRLVMWIILLPFQALSESQRRRRDVVSIKIRVSDNQKETP